MIHDNAHLTPDVHRIVQVVAGRKVPRGIFGVVIWFGSDRFGPGHRVGLRDQRGVVHWTNARNVQVLGDPMFESPNKQMAA